jgi:O-succinylbenzoate synthase
MNHGTGPGLSERGTGRGPGLSERWSTIGASASLGLLAVELWTVELPFRRAVVTAKGAHRRRPLVLVRVIANHGRTPVEGWGECAALADTTYDVEDVTRSFALLEHALVPGLIDLAPRAGMRLPRPSELGGIRQAAPDATLAFAALEMAVADAHLRAEGQSLAGLLDVAGRTVPVGAVVGRPPSLDELLGQVGSAVGEGVRRVKLKIGPGWDVVPVEGVRDAFPDLGIQVDANGSYDEGDADHLAALDRFGLLCLEQPLARDDLPGHARLAARLSTPVCLDESLESPRSVREALSLGACSVVCVKPGRLGGLGAALEVVEACSVAGVPMWIGGMYESGYGRGVNAALAALPGFSWPGDLSPAPTYLDLDLVAAPRLDRAGPTGELRVSLPTGAGLGPPPVPEVLERVVTRRRWLEVPHR